MSAKKQDATNETKCYYKNTRTSLNNIIPIVVLQNIILEYIKVEIIDIKVLQSFINIIEIMNERCGNINEKVKNDKLLKSVVENHTPYNCVILTHEIYLSRINASYEFTLGRKFPPYGLTNEYRPHHPCHAYIHYWNLILNKLTDFMPSNILIDECVFVLQVLNEEGKIICSIGINGSTKPLVPLENKFVDPVSCHSNNIKASPENKFDSIICIPNDIKSLPDHSPRKDILVRDKIKSLFQLALYNYRNACVNFVCISDYAQHGSTIISVGLIGATRDKEK